MRSASPRRRRAPTRTKDEGSSGSDAGGQRMKPRIGWDEGFEEASRRAAASTLALARRRGPRRRRVRDRRLPGADGCSSRAPGRARTSGVPRQRPRRRLEESAENVIPRVLEDPKRWILLDAGLRGLLRGAGAPFRTALDRLVARGGFIAPVRRGPRPRSPFGSVSTYGDVAKRAGSPRAARAAGNAPPTTRSRSCASPPGRAFGGGVGKYGGQGSGGRSTCSGWRGALAGP